jgi:hypothetical protein
MPTRDGDGWIREPTTSSSARFLRKWSRGSPISHAGSGPCSLIKSPAGVREGFAVEGELIAFGLVEER